MPAPNKVPRTAPKTPWLNLPLAFVTPAAGSAKARAAGPAGRPVSATGKGKGVVATAVSTGGCAAPDWGPAAAIRNEGIAAGVGATRRTCAVVLGGDPAVDPAASRC